MSICNHSIIGLKNVYPIDSIFLIIRFRLSIIRTFIYKVIHRGVQPLSHLSPNLYILSENKKIKLNFRYLFYIFYIPIRFLSWFPRQR